MHKKLQFDHITGYIIFLCMFNLILGICIAVQSIPGALTTSISTVVCLILTLRKIGFALEIE